MTMTAGVINGTSFLVYSSDVAISYSTSCSLSISGPGAAEVSTKDSGNFLTKIKKKGYGWTMSVSGMLALDGSGIDLREIQGFFRNNTTLTIKFATSNTGASGDYYWAGSAVANGFNLDAPQEEGGTWSCDFEGLGELTCVTT